VTELCSQRVNMGVAVFGDFSHFRQKNIAVFC
jgi:hypothetical protein